MHSSTNRGGGATGPPVLGLADLLAMLDFPVVVTDGAMTIRLVNQTAMQILGKSAWQLEGSTVGMAIECRHVGGKGECGASAHCAGCVLRRSISDTNADGQPRYGVYSDPEWAMATGTKADLYRFSTTKMGDAVVLALEEIPDSTMAT
jgi:hypothetical protein